MTTGYFDVKGSQVVIILVNMAGAPPSIRRALSGLSGASRQSCMSPHVTPATAADDRKAQPATDPGDSCEVLCRTVVTLAVSIKGH